MIGKIFRNNRIGISGTYFVLVVENAVFALFPFVFGKAIDGLLVNNYKIFKIYLVLFLLGVLIGTLRRIFDTRIFSKVWQKVGTETIFDLMQRDVEANKVITRAGLSTRYVDFF